MAQINDILPEESIKKENTQIQIKQEIQSDGEGENSLSIETNYSCPVCHEKFLSCEPLQDHIAGHNATKEADSNNVQIKQEPSDVDDEEEEEEKPESPASQNSESEDSDYREKKKQKPKKKQKRRPKSKLRILSCDECEYATTHRSNLRTHQRKHTGEKPFACNQCDYRSAQLVHLKEHMYIHQDVIEPIPCPKCDQTFNRPHSLRKHLKRHLTEKLYECKYCEHKALGEGLLRIHMKQHSPGYACPECGFAGKTLLQLKRHMVTHHSTTKAFKCEYCDYRTHNSNHLKTHVRVHTKEKPFKCTQCNYASTQKNHLMTHLRSHSGEKPYGCEFCSYTSTQATHVKAHRRIHTGEKPYQCSECIYATKTATELRKHRLRHHPKDSDPPLFKVLLSCNVCDYKCKMPRQLRQHKAKRHPEANNNSNVKNVSIKILPMPASVTKESNYVTLPIEVDCSIPIIKTEIVVDDDDELSC